jgi:hypothetical protein
VGTLRDLPDTPEDIATVYLPAVQTTLQGIHGCNDGHGELQLPLRVLARIGPRELDAVTQA